MFVPTYYSGGLIICSDFLFSQLWPTDVFHVERYKCGKPVERGLF